MAKSLRKSLRFDPDLLAVAEKRAENLGKSFNQYVEDLISNDTAQDPVVKKLNEILRILKRD